MPRTHRESRKGRLNGRPRISAVPCGTFDAIGRIRDPAMNRWAIFRSPSGANLSRTDQESATRTGEIDNRDHRRGRY